MSLFEVFNPLNPTYQGDFKRFYVNPEGKKIYFFTRFVDKKCIRTCV